MVAGNPQRDDEELEAFLSRNSAISTDYGNLERTEPPASLDEKILAIARAAARPPPRQAAPAKAMPVPAEAATPGEGASLAAPSEPVERRKRPRAPKLPVDDDVDATSSRRPRWLVPAAVAAAVVVVVVVGLAVFMNSPAGSGASPLQGSLFAKRARERGEADKAAAAASAAQEAEVVVLESAPLPPPPVFQAEGPQVQDLDAAIALIRKELVMVNQKAAMAEDAAARDQQSAPPAGKVADTLAAAPVAPPGVIQPRNRRLTKIIELYDDGNTDLAADSLEIFLRDFEDDPISQRILNAKP